MAFCRVFAMTFGSSCAYLALGGLVAAGVEDFSELPRSAELAAAGDVDAVLKVGPFLDRAVELAGVELVRDLPEQASRGDGVQGLARHPVRRRQQLDAGAALLQGLLVLRGEVAVAAGLVRVRNLVQAGLCRLDRGLRR
jgi:hypothetical protein